MFGMGRGHSPSQHPEAPYLGPDSCLPSESKVLPSLHQAGPGEQLSTETPPHTPPNSLKMAGSNSASGHHMGQSSEAGAVSSYHGGHVQSQPTPGLSYTSSSLGYNTAGLHDASLNSLVNYEADDKSMVRYNNDSINNIYNGTNP